MGHRRQIWLRLTLATGGISSLSAQPAPGWGVDACLTRHVSDAEFPAYAQLVESAGVRIVRERDVGLRHPDGSYDRDVRAKFRQLKAGGLMVTAFASLPYPIEISGAGDSLPEDLRAVFQAGQVLRQDFRGLVDAWEMTGEPDVGYCRDLPDRLAAYQKALYLGLKSGGEGGGPAVVMGALALPPGPWLERAARNGLLDYTDAYNFHFYGQAADLAGVIRAHRKFAEAHGGAGLPLWITECGMKAVAPGDWGNADRRRRQTDFTVATARAALAGGAAVFMPFILVEHGDPYALTLAADQPLPAWRAYASLIAATPWPKRALTRVEPRINPVVLQWLPDNRTTIPYKVSGTYRFRDRRPIHGMVRIYNFGSKPMRGTLSTMTPGQVLSTFPVRQEVELRAGEMRELPGEFAPAAPGYFQAGWSAEFVGEDGSRSLLAFGLEPEPVVADFVLTPLALRQPLAEPLRNLPYDDYRFSASAAPWQGINGVKIEATSGGGARFRVTELSGDPVGDPLYPPMAAALVDGLPTAGFLLVKPDRPLTAETSVRLDLIDVDGQRFTIWENFGQSYFAPQRILWLNLNDFHVYFWGRCSPTPSFAPAKIRELELRFYCAHAGDDIGLSFSLARPR